jgi:7-cyano-7-deazaguanine reductase
VIYPSGGCKSELELFQVDDLEISKPQGICIDD